MQVSTLVIQQIIATEINEQNRSRHLFNEASVLKKFSQHHYMYKMVFVNDGMQFGCIMHNIRHSSVPSMKNTAILCMYLPAAVYTAWHFQIRLLYGSNC